MRTLWNPEGLCIPSASTRVQYGRNFIIHVRFHVDIRVQPKICDQTNCLHHNRLDCQENKLYLR